MNKLNIWIRLSSNTSIYIVTTSKTTGLNSYLLTKFAYNNSLSATTSVSLFFANKGYYLNINIYPKCDIASFWARNFAIDLNELQSTLKVEISMV